MPKRQSIFDRHSKGQIILQQILEGEISQTKAAEVLGCKKSNINQYLKRHNLKVQKTKPQSIFEKHPDGERILLDIMSRKITKTEAAEVLGCTIGNITQYMKRHNLQVQKTKPQSSPKKKPLNLTKLLSKPKTTKEEPLNVLADQTIDFTTDQLKYLSPADLKGIQQNLLTLFLKGESNLDFSQFLKLSEIIMKMFRMQLQYNLQDEQEEQIIKLNEDDVKVLLANMEKDHCGTCEYRQYFIDQKSSETAKARLAPP